MSELTAESVLTKNDRCDACGAEALVRVDLPSGSLFFCGHHGRSHAEKLLEVQVAVYDPHQILVNTAS